MSQQTINQGQQQTINASFRAKSAGVSLFVILVIGLYYFANLLSLPPGSGAMPEGAIGLALTTVVLVIVVQSLLHIVLFIGAGQIEARTALDDQVTAMSRRNAYFVLSAGVILAVGSMIVGFTTFAMGNVLLLVLVLAEIVHYGSQLVYYRRLS